MESRDLGTHSVELHEQGTLDIKSSVARITLPATEAYELLQWLGRHKQRLYQAAQQYARQQAEQQVPAALKETSAGDDGDEIDNPVDEP